MAETQDNNQNTSPSQQAETDLALIRSMMAAGRKRAGADGAHLVLWGALLMVTFFVQYASVIGRLPPLQTSLWVITLVIGWSASFYLGKRMPRAECENNIALIGYANAWLAVGITMALYFITASIFGQLDTRTVTVLSAGTFGSAFFVISHVLQVRPLRFAAAGWWLVMIYLVQVKSFGPEVLLVMGISCGPLILVPGLFLRRLASGKG